MNAFITTWEDAISPGCTMKGLRKTHNAYFPRCSVALRSQYIHYAFEYTCVIVSLCRALVLSACYIPYGIGGTLASDSARRSAASPQQGDLKLSCPPSGQGAGDGAQNRDRRVPVDLRADTLATEPPTPPRKWGEDKKVE
ncbi:hypothetical protein PoB_007095700 [Plakobranchus ocellatus]|uniref:Uncharacterized protein n=1 Tax=Plakobranchus ocellatus TaxID=259542 RepID=A0AAV4DK81_9GAST|nr:hypothetical protein PoB_007095700 [Plakobranchus ocellatus]